VASEENVRYYYTPVPSHLQSNRSAPPGFMNRLLDLPKRGWALVGPLVFVDVDSETPKTYYIGVQSPSWEKCR